MNDLGAHALTQRCEHWLSELWMRAGQAQGEPILPTDVFPEMAEDFRQYCDLSLEELKAVAAGWLADRRREFKDQTGQFAVLAFLEEFFDQLEFPA